MRFFLTACCALSLWGCETKRTQTPARPVVATIDSMPIYFDDFLLAVKRQHLDAEGTTPSLQSERLLRESVLEDEINRRLVLRAAEMANVLVSIENVDKKMALSRQQWDEDEFEALLKEKDLTLSEYKTAIREQLLIETYFRDHVFSRLAVTDEEIESYLAEHPELLQTPEQIRVRQIVVSDKELADDLARQLRRGNLFEDFAMRHSISPEGKNGGDLGYFSRGEMPSELDDICFKLRTNEVSQVLETSYGFHLFQVIGRKSGADRPERELREEVESMLRAEKERDRQRRHIKELRASSEINVYPEVASRAL